MSLRELLNKNATVVTVVTVLVLVASLTFILWPDGGNDPSDSMGKEYFYDLNTDQLFEAEQGRIPPIDTESGPHQGKPAGVYAYVFSCGECAPREQYIGYLETYSEKAKARLEQMRQASAGPVYMGPDVESSEPFRSGILIKRPEDAQWAPKSSSRGQQIVREKKICERYPARRCRP